MPNLAMFILSLNLLLRLNKDHMLYLFSKSWFKKDFMGQAIE